MHVLMISNKTNRELSQSLQTNVSYYFDYVTEGLFQIL